MPPIRALVPALLLAACTSAAPQEPAAKGGAAAAATGAPAAIAGAPAAAPAPAEGPAPAADPGPAGAPSLARWYCLCYRRVVAGGDEPVTACRSSADACDKLQARARAGGRGIVARSLTRACQEVHAEHPGDLLGERARWAPSKVAGAWLSTGACLLAAGSPGEAEAGAAADEADASADLAAEAAAERFYAGEAIGPIAIGMRDREVIKQVGAPTRRSGRDFSEVTGGYEDRWEWEGRGLIVTMGSDGPRGPQTVLSAAIEAPSAFQTQRGVGLGEAAARVRQLYADVKAPDSDDEVADEVFVAGSVYGGLFFMFEAGKVSMIILGPGAE